VAMSSFPAFDLVVFRGSLPPDLEARVAEAFGILPPAANRDLVCLVAEALRTLMTIVCSGSLSCFRRLLLAFCLFFEPFFQRLNPQQHPPILLHELPTTPAAWSKRCQTENQSENEEIAHNKVFAEFGSC